MTSAFAQHKLVQKPSKQHRFDCLASKLHSSRVAHLNWPVTMGAVRHRKGPPSQRGWGLGLGLGLTVN